MMTRIRITWEKTVASDGTPDPTHPSYKATGVGRDSDFRDGSRLAHTRFSNAYQHQWGYPISFVLKLQATIRPEQRKKKR